MNFPETIGFTHNNYLDEWEKPLVDGKLLIWENLSSHGWTLAYEDKDEYVHKLRTGNEYQIESGMKSFYRDMRLKELLGE